MEKLKQYAVRFSEEQMRQIVKAAKKEQIGMAALVRAACRDYLDKK